MPTGAPARPRTGSRTRRLGLPLAAGALIALVAGLLSPLAAHAAAASSVEYRWTVYDAAGMPQAAPTSAGTTFTKTGTSGRKVTLTVTYKSEDVADRVVELVVQKGKAPTATGSLVVTGSPNVESTLTAPVLTWSIAPDALSYQWQVKSGSKWKKIPGAATSTYEPRSA